MEQETPYFKNHGDSCSHNTIEISPRKGQSCHGTMMGFLRAGKKTFVLLKNSKLNSFTLNNLHKQYLKLTKKNRLNKYTLVS